MFVIDTTGSMSDDIAAVKAAARDIVAQIRGSVPDARIGLVLYKDFGDEYQVTTPVALTADIDTLLAQIEAIEVSGGGDWPESVYSGLAAAIASPWRGGTVRKAVILMGDAPAHDPEEGTGLTKEHVLTRAFRADPVDTYAVVVNDDADAIADFSTLASLSGGELFSADGAEEVVPAITRAITSIAKSITVPTGSRIPGPVLIGGPKDGSAILFSPDKGAYAAGGSKVYIPGGTNVRTATADVNGDGTYDYVTGAGPGGASRLVVTDGRTGATIADLTVFEAGFTGGVFVAAADLNADGKAEVIVTPDQGGGPVVVVYDGARLSAGQTAAAEIVRFFGIDDPAFRGGARPGLGDVNGDGTQDLAVSAGFQGGPRIALFSGRELFTRVGEVVALGGRPDNSFRLVPDFFAFEDSLRNGAYVSVGDTDGDNRADLFFGGGPNGAPRVRVFGGAQVLAAGTFSKLDDIAPVAQLSNFFAGPDTLRGGVSLSVRDVDGDNRGDLLTASGLGEAAVVRLFKSATLRGGSPVADQVIDLFGGAALVEGVYVG